MGRGNGEWVEGASALSLLEHRVVRRGGQLSRAASFLECLWESGSGRLQKNGRDVASQAYSGQYGDLAATVAAILLHPEARGSPQAPVEKR